MKTSWIVVADASRARVLSTEDRAMNVSVEHELSHPESRMRAQELVSSESGRLDKGGRGILSAMDPPSDPREEEAKRFAATLAKLLDKGVAANAFQSMTLVAPPHFLGLLKAALSIQATKKLRAGVTKDLAGLPLHQLREHLQLILKEQPPFVG